MSWRASLSSTDHLIQPCPSTADHASSTGDRADALTKSQPRRGLMPRTSADSMLLLYVPGGEHADSTRALPAGELFGGILLITYVSMWIGSIW